jgi:tetratricopeptide (TPR) repeat protein
MYHPDANPDNQQQAKEKFIQLTDAYRRLTSVVQPSARAASSKTTQAGAEPSVGTNSRRSVQPPPKKVTPTPPHSSKASVPKSARPDSSQPSASPKPPPVRFPPDLSPIDRRLKQNTYEQLQQALREQRFPRAITLVEGLAQRMPNDTEVRQWQAISYQRFGRYLIKNNQPEKAKLYLRKALRTDPNNRSLWYEVERDLQRIEQVEIL